ncbi:MAG TPA: PA14 domain-containing protein [Candidatus Limnocylindria bacterium]|nr:PA14 domain-containing protein [Candidatus Limnocylindria bacterium]
MAGTNLAHAEFAPEDDDAQSKGSGNGLLGIYYATTNFTGPTVIRIDGAVNHDWRQGAPIPGLPGDSFSVRWMGTLEAPATDSYTIYFGSDDGARVFLDDQLVIANWKRREYVETNFTVNWKAGEKRKLRIDYSDFSSNACARLWWSTPSMPKTIIPQDRLHAMSFDSEHYANSAGLAGAQGLLATYYNSSNFDSNSYTRIDSQISFDWEEASPAYGVDGECFSVRWSGNLLVTNSGAYKFYILAGLPTRLYIDGQLLSDPANVAPQQIISTTLRAAKRCELRLELQVTNNIAPVRLYWSGETFSKTIVSRQHLSPVFEPTGEPASDSGLVFPPGVVLTSGAIIAAPVQSANDTSLRFQGVFKDGTLSLARVARIHIQPLSAELAAALPKGRTGVLLKNRDFIDGDFAGIDQGKITLTSVLFGRRSYNVARDVVAIVLRANEPTPWRCSIAARDGTVLYGSAISIEPGRLGIQGLPEFFITPSQVIEVVRRNERRVDAGHKE